MITGADIRDNRIYQWFMLFFATLLSIPIGIVWVLAVAVFTIGLVVFSAVREAVTGKKSDFVE